MAVATPKDLSKSKGYSFPLSIHGLIKVEAKRRGVSASHLLLKAFLWYVRTFPAGSSEPPMPALPTGQQEAQ